MKALLIFFALLNISFVGIAQNQYSNDFDFLSFTIKDTYAGYRDKVKGNEFDALVKKVKQSHNKDTFALLSQMTTFFKDRHVLLTNDDINKQAIDTQQCKKDSQMVQYYFSNRKKKDKYEGYWLSEFDYCIIAIKKVKANPATYHGYVIENKMKAIPGYCILKMTQQKDGTFYTDYIEENLAYRVFLHARFKNPNVLWVDAHGGKWQRVQQYKQGLLKNLQTFSFKPAFVVIDSNIVLLRMHDFSSYNVKRYDSIIKVNAKQIEQANTLIIDIRNNPGGYVNNYRSLLPYIYTGPIVQTGSYTLISNNFMKQYDDKIKKFTANGDTASAKNYINFRDTFMRWKGQLYYKEGGILVKDLPILPKPKNVAILVNNNCMSAAELMLLDFRQSTKVKFFGERTGGAVDYLNTMSFTLPYSKHSLSVASLKREVNKNEPSYDATGITPDVEIDDNVADWIAFVKKYYNEHQ
jgi:hypothetical protein